MRECRHHRGSIAALTLLLVAGCSADREQPGHAPGDRPGAEPPAPARDTDPASGAKNQKAAPAPEEAPPSSETTASLEVPPGFHLDEISPSSTVTPRRKRDLPHRPIELMLRSTPPGATAAVDGVEIGRTPALWRGSADGTARDFTFVLPGYGVARYRFVPLRDGVVHGTLKRLASQPAKTDSPADTGTAAHP